MNQYVPWKTYLKVSVHVNPGAHVTITEDNYKMSLIKEIYHQLTIDFIADFTNSHLFIYLINQLFNFTFTETYYSKFRAFGVRILTLRSVSVIIFQLSCSMSVFRWALREDFNFITISMQAKRNKVFWIDTMYVTAKNIYLSRP